MLCHLWSLLDNIHNRTSCIYNSLYIFVTTLAKKDRRGRYRMVVEFTTTYAISAYHHHSWKFVSRLWRGVLDTTLCDKVSQ